MQQHFRFIVIYLKGSWKVLTFEAVFYLVQMSVGKIQQY